MRPRITSWMMSVMGFPFALRSNGETLDRHRSQLRAGAAVSPLPLAVRHRDRTPAHRVEAPRARAGRREVQPHEAVQHRRDALVDGRPEAVREVKLEV